MLNFFFLPTLEVQVHQYNAGVIGERVHCNLCDLNFELALPKYEKHCLQQCNDEFEFRQQDKQI